MSRIVHGLLWLGGLLVVLLMAYTVALEVGVGGARRLEPGPASFEVAVVYPDRGLWNEFRSGVGLCDRLGRAALTGEGDDHLTLKTRVHGRTIRFRYVEARGLRETKDEVLRLSSLPDPPVAIVGSSNTVLTVAIAESLAGWPEGNGSPAPVLLIPWASAVLTASREPGEPPTPLLKIAPDRMFRFCLNNQYQADLMVAGLLDQDEKRKPRRAVIVEDRNDPFSVDLAGSFQRAVESAAPEAEIVQKSIAPSITWPRFPPGLPGPTDDLLAGSICREAEASTDGKVTWVVLPLQEEPSRRLLLALQRQARPDTPIRVLSGDAIGEEVLGEFAGRSPFLIGCFSSTASADLTPGTYPDALIPAEIVAALTHCLDVGPGAKVDPSGLRDSLASLELGPDDPAAMGRSLAFRRSGERAGDDLGQVFLTGPGVEGVYAISRGPGGNWSAPRPLAGPAGVPSP